MNAVSDGETDMEIKIDHLTKRFNEKVLFDNFSLTIEHGSICCLTGESGCGKTTLLNIIAFQEPYEGTILYDNKPVQSSREKNRMLREDISVILQEEGFVRDKTVEQNIRITPKLKHISLAQIQKMLSIVNLDASILKKKAYMLSGGEQQRILFVKALLKKPKLLLADEPTAFLDDTNRQIIMSIISTLPNQGITTLLVSHDPELIRRCTTVVTLKSQI